ncbi:MAG: amino acid permease [Simkaniaceae bacterium]|nr:amino acid permease [Simkaniaceae bacterium]
MINVAAICSIKNWPLTAEFGASSLFYFAFAALFFFIPVSLVSAELATGWPERGGVFIWVQEALGKRLGFLAIWLQWIANVIWYPTILSFIAANIAFSFDPKLAQNPTYMFVIVAITFWGTTIINLRGMKVSGWVSSIGVIIGTIIPGAVIIILGLIWYFTGEKIHIDFSLSSLIPSLSSPTKLSLLAGVLLGLAGMEMSATHAREVQNPQKNYPKAIFLSGIIIIALSVLGTLAIAIVIPKDKISLVAGGMEAISYFLKAYHLGWAVPFLAILMVIGSLGGVTAWAAGPSKGLLAAAQNGDFPPVLHKVNKNNMPIAMLVFQGIIVTLFSLIFLYFPDVNSSFWMLVVLSSQLYLIMYVLMFISAIVLRYKKPNVARNYKIPGGNVGMWIISGLGILGCVFSIIIGFFPPEQIQTGSNQFYFFFLFIGIILMCSMPYIILCFKKPSWNEVTSYQD